MYTTSLTAIITAFREAETIGRAMTALLPQLPVGGELLVVCPDAETTAVVHQFAAADPRVRHLADPGQGKPAALNLALQSAAGELFIFTDGDVVVDAQALEPLLAPFADPQVWAVTGQPVSASPRGTKLGFWSHLLVTGAHETRLRRDKAGEFLLCSGYLFALRRGIIDAIPEDALADDAVISHQVAAGGGRIRYAPAARVYVKYPDNYADWLRQKVRSAGGYAQEYVRRAPQRMRSPWLEIRDGTRLALRFPQSAREWGWTAQLFAARLHLWLLIFWRVRVRKRPFASLWQRVESTK